MERNHEYKDDSWQAGQVKAPALTLWLLWFAVAAILAAVVLGISRGAVPDEPQYAEFPPKAGHYWVVPIRVIDGDTVEFGIVVRIGRGRLPDIDCPEMDTPEGKAAKKHLEANLDVGRMTAARITGSDKYGTEIDFKGTGGYWVVSTMLRDKHAKPWPGGRGKKPFPVKDVGPQVTETRE